MRGECGAFLVLIVVIVVSNTIIIFIRKKKGKQSGKSGLVEIIFAVCEKYVK